MSGWGGPRPVTYHKCPVCGQRTGQLKRHLRWAHGWVYTAESPNMPVPPKGGTS